MRPSVWLRNIYPVYLSPRCVLFLTQEQQFDGKMFQILVPTQLSRETHKYGGKLMSLMSLHTKSTQSNSIISLIRLSVKMMLEHFFYCNISRAQTETPTHQVLLTSLSLQSNTAKHKLTETASPACTKRH